MTKIQPPVPPAFDQPKDDIKTKLGNDAKFQMWSGWLTEQLKPTEHADPTAPPQSLNGE